MNRKGVDRPHERDFFDHRPDIRKSPENLAEAQDGLYRDAEPDATGLSHRVVDYIDDFEILDQKLDELDQLIYDQQFNLSIPIDPNDRPDLAKAIVCIGGENPNIIDYATYQKAHEYWKDPITPMWGFDPKEIKTREEGEKSLVASALAQSAKVFSMTMKFVIGGTLEFAAKKAIPFPLKALRAPFLKWAKKLKDSATNDMNADDTIEKLKDLADNEQPLQEPLTTDGILGEAIAAGDGVEINKFACGNRIAEYVHRRALEHDTPGANPTSFYYSAIHSSVTTAASAKRMVSHFSLVGTPGYGNANGQKSLVPANSPALSKLTNLFGSNSKELIDKLNASTLGSTPGGTSGFFDVGTGTGFGGNVATPFIQDGLETNIRLVDHALGTLRWWFTGPDFICCLIKGLGLVGKLDLKFLYTIKFILWYIMTKGTKELEGVWEDRYATLDAIILGLMSRLLGILDVISNRAIDGAFDMVIKGLSNTNAVACSPLDELLGLLKGEIINVKLDIGALIWSIRGEFKLSEEKGYRISIAVERKQRLELFYRIVNAIINALETGQLCRQDATKEDLGVAQPPTIEEVDGFIRNHFNDEFQDSERSRAYIIEKYARDPLTGQPLDKDLVLNETSVRAQLENCGQVGEETVEEITRLLREWRSL